MVKVPPFDIPLEGRILLTQHRSLAQWADKTPTVDQFSAFSLRAPEVILHAGFTPAIDIWAVGCIVRVNELVVPGNVEVYMFFQNLQVFEMLVGRWLFHPVDGGSDWNLEEDHLAKMLEMTGEAFSTEMLRHAEPYGKYLDEKGWFVYLGKIKFNLFS